MAALIKQETFTALLMMKKLASYPIQNGLAKALREIGRIERSLCIDWVKSGTLGWEHINLSGDYVWRNNLHLGSGKYHPYAQLTSCCTKKLS